MYFLPENAGLLNHCGCSLLVFKFMDIGHGKQVKNGWKMNIFESVSSDIDIFDILIYI